MTLGATDVSLLHGKVCSCSAAAATTMDTLSCPLPSRALSTDISVASLTRPGGALPLLCHQRKLEKPQAFWAFSTWAWASSRLLSPQQLLSWTCPGFLLWSRLLWPSHPTGLSLMDLPDPTSAPHPARHQLPWPDTGSRKEAGLGAVPWRRILLFHSLDACGLAKGPLCLVSASHLLNGPKERRVPGSKTVLQFS